MTVQILNMFQNIFTACFNIFSQVINAIPGMSALIIAFFFTFMAIKFFILPFIGGNKSRSSETKGYEDK